MSKVFLCLVGLVSGAAACGSDAGEQLFVPKAECMDVPVQPYAGTNPQVINSLQIGTVEDGFDLDHNGKPDNKLAAVGSLAQSAIDDSFKNYSIIVPLEFYGMPAIAADDCVKFAIFLGKYVTDADNDGKNDYVAKGDCNDHDPNIHPGATEVPGNFKDDDCDGLADEDGQNAPNTTETADADGDGQSVAQGDCDDTVATGAAVKKGGVEICGDGLDNDCDGVADRSVDVAGNATACSPFEPGKQDIPLDPLSFSGADPVISFKDGTISSALVLDAGPSIFSVNIPVTDGLNLDLKITGATIQATLEANGTTMNGRLGGVIDAKTADTIRGLDVSQIGLLPENSLLDATFANLLGPLLALPKANASISKKYPGCRTPDIDVDGDGLEAFCDSNPNDDIKEVDTCIDGDGTVIKDTETTQCTEALKNGKPRFVDGISVELNFTTSAIKSIKPPPTL